MRLLVIFFALALSAPGWSAQLAACAPGDSNAVMAKVRQYIMPAPDAPQHRLMVWKSGDGWSISEYSGLRVSIRCRPASKADELNGVQFGEIDFTYEASRETDLPRLTSAGLQPAEWSKWTDPSFWDKDVSFRKYKGKIQLEWEYVSDSEPELMSMAELNHFFSTADAEAAKLRMAEEEQAKLQKERAMQVEAGAEAEAAYARNTREANAAAQVTRAVDPDDYYPPGSVRREEQGSPIVKVCVGPSGRLLRDPVVTDTSGFPDLDGAAIKVAKAMRYAAGKENGIALPESCRKFKVKFTLKND